MDAEASELQTAPDPGHRAFAMRLHRGGELLRAGRLADAESEVIAALQHDPADTRARNLLGLIYFRAGRHDDAFSVFNTLAAEEPENPAVRLNLGLCELRMGRHADAAANLRVVVGAEPANQKAQGYYGLALMRSGELVAARQAFIAAGQDDLARRVADQLAAEEEGGETVAAGGVALAAVANLPDEVPLESFAGADTAVNGVDAVAGVSSGLRLGKPQPVSAFLAARELRSPAAEDTFALADSGILIIRVEGRLPTRIVGALASSGRLAYAPLARRVRGSDTQEAFGEGDNAMCLATGSGLMVVSPRSARFNVLSLHDEVIYLRETVVFSFEETLSWENGRIPGSGGVRMVQFRGEGRVVMRTERMPYTVRLTTGEVLYADQDALLGWTGQVVPQQLRGIEGEATPFVSCAGEGSLILIDPAERLYGDAAPVPTQAPG